MKQIVALLLVFVLLLSVTACGEKESTGDDVTTTTTTESGDTTTESGDTTTTTVSGTTATTKATTTAKPTTTTTAAAPLFTDDQVKSAAGSIIFYQQFFSDRIDFIKRTDFKNIQIETVFDFTFWYVGEVYENRAESYTMTEGVESLTIKVSKANAIVKSVFGENYDYKTLGARTDANDELWYDAATDSLRFERFSGGFGDQPMYRYLSHTKNGNNVDVKIGHIDWDSDPENGAIAFTYTLKLKYADDIFQILSFKKD